MPTYQYECEACRHEFEISQSMNDNRLKKCPKCGKNKLSRLIGSGSGIIFKGTGFYETDYKQKGVSKSDKSGKSDSKPAPAPAKSGSHGCSPTCGCG